MRGSRCSCWRSGCGQSSAPEPLQFADRVLVHRAFVRTQFSCLLQRIELGDTATDTAAGMAHPGALLGHAFQQFTVHLVLVLQTAHEAATWTADLLRVQGQLLVTGHAETDRRATLQPGGGARTTAA